MKAAFAASLERMRGVNLICRADPRRPRRLRQALFFVYLVLIFGNVILIWVQQFRPIPYNLTLRAVLGFIEDTTNPYLNLFRRLRSRGSARSTSARSSRSSSSRWSAALVVGLIRG